MVWIRTTSQCAAFTTRLPPWFTVRNENFIAFPDTLRRAPNTHSKLTRIKPIVPNESTRSLWDSSVIVDKSRLVTRFVSVDPQAQTIGGAVQTEVVVRRRAIIRMYFTWMNSSVSITVTISRGLAYQCNQLFVYLVQYER